MGFEDGEITHITAQPTEASEYGNVYVQFRVKEPYYGYLWEDSRAQVGAADFLGHRFIEVTKGTNGAPTYALYQIQEIPLAELPSYAGSNNIHFAQEIFQGTNILIHVSPPITT